MPPKKKRNQNKQKRAEEQQQKLLEIQKQNEEERKRKQEEQEKLAKEREEYLQMKFKEAESDKRTTDYDLWGNKRDFQIENTIYSEEELQKLYNKWIAPNSTRLVPIQNYNFNNDETDEEAQRQLEEFYKTQEQKQTQAGISNMMYTLGSSLPMMVLQYGIGTTLGVGAIAAAGYGAFKGYKIIKDWWGNRNNNVVNTQQNTETKQ